MYKKTKIVATISDMRCDVGLIQRLYDAGMNVVRLNTAHQDAKGMKRVIDNVREVSSHIAILVDTKGPEVRTTITDQPIEFHKGDIVTIVGRPEQKTTRDVIAVSYPGFVNDLNEGAQILIDDGDLGIRVDHKEGNELICHVENDATLGSRKSVNVPGVRINLPALTEKDKRNIEFAIDYDVAWCKGTTNKDIVFCKVVAGRAGNKPALPAHSCFIRMGSCKSESRVFAHLSVDLWCKPSTDVLSCRRIFDRKHQARHAFCIQTT